MNTDELAFELSRAERREREIQTKLHRWACVDTHRKFDDLFNLVCDSAFLLVAWDRLRGNKGARTAGMDGRTAFTIEAEQGVEVFLDGLRSELKAAPLPPPPPPPAWNGAITPGFRVGVCVPIPVPFAPSVCTGI